MGGKFADFPTRIRTVLILAIVCIPAVVFRTSLPWLFIAVCSLVATLSIIEAIWLLRKALARSSTPWATTTRKLKENSYEAFFTIILEYALGVTALILYDHTITWLIIISSFGYDIFAIIFGRLLGGKFFKKKPCPNLSEKKTWEGVIGGLALSIILSWTYLIVFTNSSFSTGITPSAILASVGGSIAFLGDLSCSRLKRLAKEKDSGTLLPGHGGALDRFASLFAVAASYFFLYLPLYLSNIL